MATWLTVAVLGVFLLAYALAPVSVPGSRAMLTSEFLKQYGYSGGYNQRLAYLSSVMAIIVSCISTFLVAKARSSAGADRNAVYAVNGWQSLVLVAIALVVFWHLVPHYIVGAAACLAAIYVVLACGAPRIRPRLIQGAALALIGVYVAILVVPGLLIWPIPILVSEPDSVAQVELHLLSLVQPGSAIASGQRFFQDIPMGYGLLMPSVLSVIDLRLGPITAGDHVRFVQYCQVVFTLTAVAAYICYRPRSYFGVLIALLLAAPYWASAGLGNWHPNQTGLRSLAFPIGILALILAGRHMLQSAAWVLGAVGGLAVLINPETAVAVGAGYFVYLALRTRGVPVGLIVRAIAAGIAVFLVYLIVYRLALGRNPFARDLSSIFMSLRAHVSGSIGLPLFTPGFFAENYYLVPFAFAMFAHAAFIVIAAFRDLARYPLSHRRALRAAIATVLIVWFGYYFNLPNWWQIWTHLFLYGFLLIDFFDLRRLGTGNASVRPGFLALSAMRSRLVSIVPLILLSMMIPHTNGNLLYYTRDFMFPPWTRADRDAALVSDILVPRVLADALKQKAKKLLELKAATNGGVRFLTYNVEFVPMLTRTFEPAPMRTLWSIFGDDALDPAIDSVFAARPAVILVDAPTGPLAVSGARKEFQDRVRRSVLREYHLAETTDGWEIYRPGRAL